MRICTPELQYEAEHRTKVAGTILTAAGTLVYGVTGKVLKIHQYTLSVLGTAMYSFNDAKPTGGTVHFGAYISSGLLTSPKTVAKSPYVPYPAYLMATSTKGSALCLGTYAIPPVLGTVLFNCVYTDADVS